MKRRVVLASTSLILALALSSCDNGRDQSNSLDRITSGGTGDTLVVSADPSERLTFAPDILTTQANQPFKIQFGNPASLPHSLVLVQPGQEDAALSAGLAAGGTVPDGTPGVVAASAVLNKGETATLDVQGLEAGMYPYICTVPGHYEAGMKGTLTVSS